MKRLILLRHAKSSWDDTGLADEDRPLAGRGLRDAPRMGERLAKHGAKPDLLLTSPAVRARRTAELVASALEQPGIVIRREPRLYLASPGELLDVISTVDDAVEELMLVGHNPGLTDFINKLLPELRLHNLPTAGVVAVNCDTDSWSRISAAGFRLRFYDYPKKAG
jgi:phosphohistidine phosphatase